MKTMIKKCLLVSIVLLCASAVFGDYPIKEVPFASVKPGKSFWEMRMETNRTTTIPHVLRKCEETGRFQNFRTTIGIVTGKFQGLYFNDSDVYKSIEAVGYSLSNYPDAQLEQYADTIIRLITLAQQTNGYLDNRYTIDDQDKKWTDTRHMHELYCAGHFFDAAVGYYTATGKREILDTAIRLADHICDVFGPGKKADPPGHQQVEMGLVRLYRVTGNTNYLNLAQFFLDQRGRHENRNTYKEYGQDHDLVTNQFQAVGHAVRATYMYSGMTEVAVELNPPGYTNALDRLWNDIVQKRYYITGGIGTPGGGEAFGPDYYLPNSSAYSETCAGIALVNWNQRMFRMTGDAKYIDVLERTLYNAVIDGMAITGNKFFYPNPLASDGRHQRREWFDCACCPPNMARFIAAVPGFMYATEGDTLYVNLYGKSDMNTTLDGTALEIQQDTEYPWNGKVKMTVTPAEKKEFTVAVRIPGWARNEPVPSDLYTYADANDEKVTVSVNGTAVDGSLDKGYVKLTREWNPGDTITVDMPMPVRRVVSHPEVKADKGLIALQRGPLVYCAEGPDNGTHVFDLYIPDSAELKAVRRPDLFNGIDTIEGDVVLAYYPKDGTNIVEETHKLVAIPYYAWAHRGRGNMSVWLARTVAAAKPELPPSIASTSRVSASNVNRRWSRSIRGINNQEEPESSEDFSSGGFAWYRQQGTKEWVQYDFANPTNVKSVAVYWMQSDRGVGLPESWKVLYKAGEEWKPVENTTPYTQELDKYNRVKFESVHTPSLRIEVQLPADKSSGILEWKVE